ncbi:MAG: metallophosphoesterase [Pseudomonadota bacterium]
MALIFFVYPLARLGAWWQWPGGVVTGVCAFGFASQFISRFALRNPTRAPARFARQALDGLLGISPVLLVLVLAGEVVLWTGALSPFWVANLVLLGTLAAALYGALRARTPEIVEITVPSSKLDAPVRFAQISDVHIGSRSGAFLERVMARVQAAKPDFLCITGDLVDQVGITQEQLAPIGRFDGAVYFSTGNHEFYEDLDAILERLTNLGVRVLRQATAQQGAIQIIGVDDHDHPDRLQTVLPQLPLDADAFKLLMYHRPTGLEHAADHDIDLMISGHTHNGQIKPFDAAVRLQFKYLHGAHRAPNGDTLLYVNQGTGTWGPTLRLGTRCEITVFTLQPVS